MKVAAALLIVIATIGCLLSCGDESQEQQNYPPRIILESVVPPDTGTFTMDINDACSPITFSVGGVEDENIYDTLFVAWFMNWQPGQNDGNVSWTFIHPIEEEIREGPDLDLSTRDFKPGEFYSIRVIIADRPAQMCSEGIEFLEDGNGQYDFYEWTFDAVEGMGYCVPQ